MTWVQRFIIALLCLLPTPTIATTLLYEGWEGTPASIASYPNEWWDTSCGAGSWPSTSNPGLSTARAFAGSRSMRSVFTGTQYDTPPHGGCFASKFFTRSTEVWITWMEYWENGFITAGGAIGGAGTKDLYVYGHRPSTQNNAVGFSPGYLWGGKELYVGAQGVYDASPQWDTYSMNQNVNPLSMPDNKWVCYEIHLKLNTPGQANGEYQLYSTNMTDGGSAVLRANWTGRRWLGNNTTDPAPSDTAWDQLKEYVQDGLGTFYHDEIYVTTTRQGCSGTPPTSDTTPPPIPQTPTTPAQVLPLVVNWISVSNPGDLAGYKFYRKLEACSGSTAMTLIATLGNVVTYTDTTIPNSTTNACVKISSYDTSSNESALSTGRDVSLTPPASSVRRTTVTDTFSAGNSNPLPSPWLGGYTGNINFQVLSGQAGPVSSEVTDVAMIRNETTPNDQWACVELSTYTSGTSPGVILRMAAPPTFSGYEFRFSQGVGRIAEWTAGSWALLSSVSFTPQVNDLLCGEAEGSALRLYYTRSGVSTLLTSSTDSTYASGRRGLMTYNAGVQNATMFDNFTAGDFTSGTPTNDTFSTLSTVTLDSTGADLVFNGLAHKIRYWNNLHPRTAPVEVVGLGGVASYRHNKTWEVTPVAVTFVCYESQGSDGIWESDKVTDSYVCGSLSVTSTDTTAPATPTGLGVR